MNVDFKEALTTLTLIWNHKIITIGEAQLGLGNILIALFLLLFATRLSQMVVNLINRRLILPFVEDRASQITYQTFSFYGFLALFVVISLTFAGIPLTVFSVVGGALAIGVGFGSQNIVNNFISGMILLVERPIKLGDVIEVEGMLGTVVSIGTRSTKIRNIENKIFLIPNSFFLEKSVLNSSYETRILRATIDFGVSYQSDVRLVENICMDIMLNTEGIEQAPLPIVLFSDFAESNLTFQLVFYCNLTKVTSLNLVRSDVRYKINDKFREMNISMAYPQRDMHLKVDRALSVKLET